MLVLVDSIPIGTSGKQLRRELSERLRVPSLTMSELVVYQESSIGAPLHTPRIDVQAIKGAVLSVVGVSSAAVVRLPHAANSGRGDAMTGLEAARSESTGHGGEGESRSADKGGDDERVVVLVTPAQSDTELIVLHLAAVLPDFMTPA